MQANNACTTGRSSLPTRSTILYVTDLTYQANGRRYCDEDVFLSSQLRDDFRVALCHPLDVQALMSAFDLVMVRNSGPVLHYQAAYRTFRTEALNQGIRVYNPLTGRADMTGKQYLVDLTLAGYPVIPTIDTPADIGRLPAAERYVVKPKLGADSIGIEIVTPDELHGRAFDSILAQPRIDFRYEVSFYYIDREFQYALRAPTEGKRWDLEPYEPGAADLEFAQLFVDWNDIDHGIQRVDACRTQTGKLLLVELEDLNPFLSLDLVDTIRRTAFVTHLKASIHALLGN